jgi:hypothetical protein
MSLVSEMMLRVNPYQQTELPPPRTLEEAYTRYIGHGTEIADWEAYENAIDKIMRGTVSTFGHLPTCINRTFPSDLRDNVNIVYEGNAAVKCANCGGIIGHPFIQAHDPLIQPDETEVEWR